LLTSTTVGTLDFRSVAVSIMHIQPALQNPPNAFLTATAKRVCPEEKRVVCSAEDGAEFTVPYDYLAISTGAQGSTFGIEGVKESAYFLRDVAHADQIRRKLVTNIGLAQIPGTREDEKRRLLHFVVVGGGPTGVEFSSELANFVNEDLMRFLPETACHIRITLVECGNILSSFTPDLQSYAGRKLSKSRVEIVKASVKAVEGSTVILEDGSRIAFGMLVWCAGVGPTDFIGSLPFARTKDGRLMIDDFLRVLHPDNTIVRDVFALGDCSACPKLPLPTLAQVAEKQGKYLAKALNAKVRSDGAELRFGRDIPAFRYVHLGSMVALTTGSAVTEIGKHSKPWTMRGFMSFLGWRSAYLTKLGSLRNRLYVMMNWTTTMILGRDLTRW